MLKYIVENCLILIPALNIAGRIIKGTEKINDRYIPLILLFLSTAGCVAILGFHADAFIQGVLIAGAAVYNDQLVKQLSAK